MIKPKMGLKKQDKIALSAYKTFRYVLDRIYDPRIQNEVVRLGGGYPVAGLLPLADKFSESLTHYYRPRGWKQRPGYDSEGGNALVREAIARYENKKSGTAYKTENIALVAGATYGINRVLEIIFKNNHKKEFLVIAPTFYKPYHRALELCRFRSTVISEEQGFVPSAKDILDAVSKNTLAVAICNPGNPSGKYLPLNELKMVAQELCRKKVYLLIDEVQDYFSFTTSPYRYEPWIQAPNIIRVRSTSKEFTLAEYRIGYVVANRHIIGDNHQGLIELVGYDMGNPPPALNRFFMRSLGLDRSGWTKILLRQKNLTISLLQKVKAVKRIINPEACFNLTFSFKHPNFQTDLGLFNALIDHKVAMMPLSGFGYDPRACWMRLTFASPDAVIRKGIKVLKELLA